MLICQLQCARHTQDAFQVVSHLIHRTNLSIIFVIAIGKTPFKVIKPWLYSLGGLPYGSDGKNLPAVKDEPKFDYWVRKNP